jgi:GNAT superfamily N-acetyltransferase
MDGLHGDDSREASRWSKPMNRARSKLTWLALLLKAGQPRLILEKLRRKIYSSSTSFCLRRDLTQSFEAPTAKISITVRPLQGAEAANLFNANAPGLSANEMNDRIGRMGLFRNGIPQCHVAIDENGAPCYAQWLMSSADNDRIQEYFRGTFPVLAPDEALLEGAFTPESHRGQGIMPRAMALIAERARDFGARYVITFVADDNIPSLKGCKRSGFAPYMLRKMDWRWLRPRVTFLPLSEGKPYPLDREKAMSKTA